MPKNSFIFSNNIFISFSKRLLSVLIIYSITRLLFLICNLSFFNDIQLNEYLPIFWGGLRFDISTIFISNAVFILFYLIPLKIVYKTIYQRIIIILFYIVNSFAFLLNFIDIIYLRFTFKRTTSDIFNYVSVGGDFDKLLPQFIKDFWFIPILWISTVVFFIYLNSRIKKIEKYNFSTKTTIIHSLLYVGFILLSIIGIRGGFQLRPLDIINAGKYANSKNIPLVLNTPFSIIKTLGLPVLEKKEYFTNEREINSIYTPLYNTTNQNDTNTKKLNVVVVILESFSQEHIGGLNNIKGYQGFTPFLDSLIKKSYVAEAYANGKRSIEGIPAILASVPTLMNEAYVTSMYSGNKINSLASILKEEGYITSFYHGGSNGTMGFDAFTKIAGFDIYKGRHEYHNEKDYDGKWGIFDEPYMQYYANELNTYKQPFFSSIFTLSSHHPYTVPENYKGKFRKGKLEIQESIMYADYALNKFFEKASKMPWYKNTLFVLTADHTSEAQLDYYKNSVGMYAIPIIYYIPENDTLKLLPKKISQQTDILPSVLGLLNYKGSFLSFGKNIFKNNEESFSISYLNGEYQLIADNYMLKFNGKNSISLYNLKNDSLLKKNLIFSELYKKKEMETFIKAYIQQYNNRMINNKMTNN
jgi:phosphoglycerol transferase MdoB-like AlkP superfamily enzyme